MGIQCRIIRDNNGNIDYVEAPNGNRSQLYDNAVEAVGEEAALDVVLTAYTPAFQEDVKNPRIVEYRNRLIDRLNRIPTTTTSIILNLEGLDYSLDPTTMQMETEFLGNDETLFSFTAELNTVNYAPNGKISNLNNRQWNEVRSPEFMEWSNDWNDVIKDENGEPQVHYHGTVEDRFTNFASEQGVQFFTSNRNVAETYAGFEVGNPNSMYEVYVKSENTFDPTQELSTEVENFIRENWKTLRESIDDLTSSGRKSLGKEKTISEIKRILKEDNNWEILENETFLNFLREQGYTGFRTLEQGGNNIGIFNSTDIKSAEENVGTFSGETSDIRYQVALADRLPSNEEILNSVIEKLQKTGLAKDVNIVTEQELREVLEQGGHSYQQGINGAVIGDQVYLNKDVATAETAIHEFGHLWNSWAQQNAPELYERGINLVKSSEGEPYVNYVKETQPNLEGDALYEEALAQAIGDNGNRIVEASKNSDFKKWLKDLWKAIKDLTRITHHKTVKDLENMTLNDFASSVAVDLLTGNQTFSKTIDPVRPLNLDSTPFVYVRDDHSLSHVRKEDMVNMKNLVEDIVSKNQKVGFWMADQLGIGEYTDEVTGITHQLDAGISYALDPKNRERGVIWASGLAEKDINNLIQGSDYLFMISGSPEAAKRFNKKMIDILESRIPNLEQFKQDLLERNPPGKFKELLEKLPDTYEELRNSPLRKELLNAIESRKGKNKPDAHYLAERNAYLDYDGMRDGYLKENNFNTNDVVLVLKPTGVGGKAEHSTYDTEVLGEVVGIPDRIINAYDLLPTEERSPRRFTEMGRSQQHQVIAPYGRGVSEVQAEITSNHVGFNEGIVRIEQEAREYKEINNINIPSHPPVYRLNTEISREISDAYEQMEHNPNDPEVKAAYEAMVEETAQQYDYIISKGIEVIRYDGEGEPYVNSNEMLQDLRQGRLKFLPNDEAFGTNTEAFTDNIGLQKSGRKLSDGYEMTNSEVFRVVHDYFGHGILGNQFGAIGEENATLQHASMFSPKAQPAMIAQTRGQNSWVNFSGVNNEAKALFRQARQLDREGNTTEANKLREEANRKFKFAEPKIGLLPDRYNFTKYETARRLQENKQIESLPDPENNDLSTTLARYTNENRTERGISRKGVQRTTKLRGYDVDIINEYDLDNTTNENIRRVFPKFLGVQKIYEITNGEVYRNLQIKALEKNKFKASVTIHSAEEYNNMRMFITEDASTGITLTNDGFLGGAFADPTFERPNNLAQLMILGIKEGAITAEAFDTVLPDYYSNYGFKAVSRTAFNEEYKPMKSNGALEDWSYETYKRFNNGRPDVVFFIYDGGDRSNIEERIGQFDVYSTYERNNTSSYDKDNYEKAYREMEIAAVKRGMFEHPNSRPRFSVGFIQTKGNQITLSNVDPQIQGQGVGTEMYKQVARNLAQQGEALTSDFNRKGAESIWNRLEDHGVVEIATVDGKEVKRIKMTPDSFDSNGEVDVNSVIRYIQSRNYENEVLSQEEISEVENMMLGEDIIDSEDLYDTLRRAFMPNGVYNPSERSLTSSGLYSTAEARRLLDSEDLQMQAYEMIHKLKNSDVIPNDIEVDDSYVTITPQYNKLGTLVKTNPYINQKTAREILGGIQEEGQFQSQADANDLNFATHKFSEFSTLTRVDRIKEDGTPHNTIDTIRERWEETLTLPETTTLVENLDYLLNTSNEVWNLEYQNVRTLLEELENNAVDIGLDLSQLAESSYDKTPSEVKELLNTIRNFAVEYNESTFEAMLNSYVNFFNISQINNSEVVDVTEENRNKSLVYLDTRENSFELFQNNGLLPLGNNVYQRVNTNRSYDATVDLIYQHILAGNNLVPNAFKVKYDLTQPINEEFVRRDIDNYANERSKDIDNNQNYDAEELKKMVLYSDYFKTSLNNEITSPNLSEEINLVTNYPNNAEYLTTDFIADFNKEIIRARIRNTPKYNEFYRHFDVNSRGIQLLNNDPITLRQIQPHLTDNLVNYFRIKKDGLNLREYDNTIDNIPHHIIERNFYSNYPKALPRYKDSYHIDGDKLVTNTNQDFIRVNEGVFEYVETIGNKAMYSRLPINNSEYKSYNMNMTEPNLGNTDKFNFIRGVQADRNVNQTYTQAQNTRITNQIDNC